MIDVKMIANGELGEMRKEEEEGLHGVNKSASFNPLKPKLVPIIFQYSICTSRKTELNHYKDQLLNVV
jgi:hypothetical protein